MPTSNPYYPLAVPTLGVQAARHPRAIDPAGLRAAENVLYRDGVFGSRPGSQTFGGLITGERIMGFFQYDAASETKRLMMATTKNWYRWDKATSDWIKVLDGGVTLTGTEANQVIFRAFQIGSTVWLLGVNGKDTPKAWDGNPANAWRNFGGGSRVARCIAVADDHVILGGFVDGPQEVEYSNLLNFDLGWATNTKRFGETPGIITGLAEMGAKAFVVAKSDALYAGMRYTPEVPFTYEGLYLGLPGPVSPASLVTIPGGGFYYVGWDGAVYAFDGSSAPRSVGPDVQRWISDNWYATKKDRTWGFYSPLRREIWIGIPALDTLDMSRAVVLTMPGETLHTMRWDALRMSAGIATTTADALTYAQMTGTYASYPGLYADYATERAVMLFGGTVGQAYSQAGSLDAGAAIPGFWEYGLQSLDSAARWKTVVAMEHYFGKTVAAQLISIRFRTVNRGEDGTLTAPSSFDVSSSGLLRTGHRVHGRMIGPRYEFSASEQVIFEGAEAALAGRGLR